MAVLSQSEHKSRIATVATKSHRYGDTELIVDEGDRYFVKAQITKDAGLLAALACQLVTILECYLVAAPCPVDDTEVKAVIDALSSLAEFPGVNEV